MDPHPSTLVTGGVSHQTCRRLRHARGVVRQQRALARVGLIALAGVALEDLFDETVRTVCKATQVDYSFVSQVVMDDRRETVRICAAVGAPRTVVGNTFELEPGSPISQVASARVPEMTVYDHDAQAIRRSSWLRELNPVSSVAVQIPLANGLFGVLSAHATKPKQWKRHLPLLKSLAAIVGLAIRRKDGELHATGDAQMSALERDAVVVVDGGGRVFFWNRSAEGLYGFSRDEAIGRTFYDLLETDFRSSTREAVGRALRTSGRWSGALVHRCKNGSRVSVASRQTTRTTGYDPPNGVLIIDVDESEQTRIRTAVRRREAEAEALSVITRAALEGASGLRLYEIAVKAVKDAMDACSSTISEVCDNGNGFEIVATEGLLDDLPVGTTIDLSTLSGFTLACGQTVVVDDFATESRFRVLDFLRRRDIASSLSTPVRVDGKCVAVMVVHSTQLRHFNEDDVHFLESVADLLAVTLARIRAENAYRESAAIHFALMESARDAIVLVDEEGLVVECNQSALRLFGYTDMSGTPVHRLLPALKNSSFVSEDEVVHELTGYRADGTELPLEVSISHGAMGAAPFVTIIGRDVSERLRAAEELRRNQEQLAHSQKMEDIGRLAGGVAHDFNNLLSAILGYTELVLMHMPENAACRDELGEIRSAGERAASLTRQLLAFSRRQVMQPRVVAVGELVSNLLNLLRRLIGEDVELVPHISSQAETVRVDPGQLEQVIINLAVNARDAMPLGGQLTIGVQSVSVPFMRLLRCGPMPAGEYVEIAVVDTGCGMNEDTMARIFEPFFTTKEPGKGTGLGLSTVYGIVGQSQGYIDVQSAVGKGTRFCVYLPGVSEPCVAPESAEPALECGSETVLVVEDEVRLRKLMVRVLEDVGYKVLEAADGNEALMLAEQFPSNIDLLVTDVVMPRMSGRELASKMTERRPGIRVLFMSGYTDDAVLRYGVSEAEVEFIQKPMRPSQLLRRVRMILGKRGL